MHMPEMDGVALARKIRQMPTRAAADPVQLAGPARHRCEDDLFSAYLAKPLRQSQLFDTLVTLFAPKEPHRMQPVRDARKAAIDPKWPQRHPLRILLAEDNLVNQKLAMRLLEQMGYRADLASNGLEAAGKRGTPDL